MSKAITCFKAYDARGKVPDELNPEIAYRIGRAYAAIVHHHSSLRVDQLGGGNPDHAIVLEHLHRPGQQRVGHAGLARELQRILRRRLGDPQDEQPTRRVLRLHPDQMRDRVAATASGG